MNPTVLVGLLSLAGTLIGTFGGILTSNRLTNYRLEQLEKKVDKHNNIYDRQHEIEQELAVQKEKIAVANHRIEDLERGKSA